MLLVVGLGVVTLGLLLALGRQLRGVSPKVNKAQLTFSEAQFWDVVDIWKRNDKLTQVHGHFKLDYLFLLAYGGFGLTLASELLACIKLPSTSLSRAWPWFLPAAAVLDALENLLHQRFLREGRGASSQFLYVLSGCSASAKWLLLVLYLAVLCWWAWVAASAP